MMTDDETRKRLVEALAQLRWAGWLLDEAEKRLELACQKNMTFS